jgi:hypothetical protein
LCIGALGSRGLDSWHRGRSVTFHSTLQEARFYRAGWTCAPISVPRTSTRDLGAAGITGTRRRTRPDGFRGSTRAGRTRRLAWSTWRHGTCGTDRRKRCDRRSRVNGTNRARGRRGRNGVRGTDRADGRCGRHWICGPNRAHRRSRASGADWRHRHYGRYGTCGTNRDHGRCRHNGVCGTNRGNWRPGVIGTDRAHGHCGRHWICGTNRAHRRRRAFGTDWPRRPPRIVGIRRVLRAHAAGQCGDGGSRVPGPVPSKRPDHRRDHETWWQQLDRICAAQHRNLPRGVLGVRS